MEGVGFLVFCAVIYAVGSLVWSVVGWVLGTAVIGVVAVVRRVRG